MELKSRSVVTHKMPLTFQAGLQISLYLTCDKKPGDCGSLCAMRAAHQCKVKTQRKNLEPFSDLL